MISVILACHGRLAQELLNSANMLFGTTEKVWTVDFKVGEGLESLKKKYTDILKQTEENSQVLILTDIFGGSPYNAAAELAAGSQGRIEVIAGTNLSILIETLSQRRLMGLEELALHVLSVGKQGITAFSEVMKQCDLNIQEEL